MTTKMTITEALAECKLIVKKINSADAFIKSYLTRPEIYRDPLEKDGGSAKAITEKSQAISDLRERIIKIRKSINDANRGVDVEIRGVKRTVEEWLIWKREVYDQTLRSLRDRQETIMRVRSNTARGSSQRYSQTGDVSQSKDSDIVVNISEVALQNEIDEVEAIYGELDGRLSLLDATIMVEIPD